MQMLLHSCGLDGAWVFSAGRPQTSLLDPVHGTAFVQGSSIIDFMLTPTIDINEEDNRSGVLVITVLDTGYLENIA